MKIAIDINDVIRDNMFQFRYIYQKYVDSSFEIDLNDIDTYNMLDHYPFEDESELNQFKYLDYPFELYGRAEACDKRLPYALNDYLEKTLKDLDYLDSVWIKEDGEVFEGWVFDFTRRCIIVVYGNDLRDFRFRLEKPLDRTEIEQDGKILYCNNPNNEL